MRAHVTDGGLATNSSVEMAEYQRTLCTQRDQFAYMEVSGRKYVFQRDWWRRQAAQTPLNQVSGQLNGHPRKLAEIGDKDWLRKFLLKAGAKQTLQPNKGTVSALHYWQSNRRIGAGISQLSDEVRWQCCLEQWVYQPDELRCGLSLRTARIRKYTLLQYIPERLLAGRGGLHGTRHSIVIVDSNCS
jgi:hypothetical protein